MTDFDFTKMAEPPPDVVHHQKTLDIWKANIWTHVMAHQDEVSEAFGQIDATLASINPLLGLFAAHVLLESIKRRNAKLQNFPLLEEAVREVVQHFTDTAFTLTTP